MQSIACCKCGAEIGDVLRSRFGGALPIILNAAVSCPSCQAFHIVSGRLPEEGLRVSCHEPMPT